MYYKDTYNLGSNMQLIANGETLSVLSDNGCITINKYFVSNGIVNIRQNFIDRTLCKYSDYREKIATGYDFSIDFNIKSIGGFEISPGNENNLIKPATFNDMKVIDLLHLINEKISKRK